MAWSTRELAELAGTTLNTIRHYHRLGLMEEPDRRSNGYKQYGAADLVRLLRIRRLADLGVPLAQIGEFSASTDGTREILHELDAELGARIEQLQHARASIAAILSDGASADVPAGFETVASRLSEADSAMVHLYTQMYDEQKLADLKAMVAADTDAASADVGRLPPDADEDTRVGLIQRLVPTLTQTFLDYPWLLDPASPLPKQRHVSEQTFIDAVTEFYNPAQRDVLSRASVLAIDRVRKNRRGTAED